MPSKKSKIGRPRAEVPLDSVLSVRLAKIELRGVKAVAKLRKLTPSAYARAKLLVKERS